MNEPILTVIIFTYNQKDVIARCIESVVNQNTKYKYEVHIADDASTDGTSDICREMAQKYPDKIKLFIQEKNTFRNPPETNHVYMAYRRIKTKYWCSIDGDDNWCDENKIEIGINKLEENPNCYTFGHNTLIENAATGETSLMTDESIKEGIYGKYDGPPFIHVSARIHKTIPDLVERELFGDAGIYLYYKSIAPIYYVNRTMSRYNWDESGIWTQLPAKYRFKLAKMQPFRMCQYSNFENEDYWLSMVDRKRDKAIIKILKIFTGKKLAWHIWFAFKFVPTFGWGIMSKDYMYRAKDKVNKFK